MTRKRSKSLFVIFAILLVICLIACFVNFTYPFSIGGNYYSYSNFVSNIKLGEDVGNSLRIVYRAELPENESDKNYTNLKNNTMDSLKDIVQGQGYKDVTVAEYGDANIALTIGNILNEEDINTIKTLIGKPATISFSKNSDGSEPFAKSECIKSVTTTSTSNEGKMYYYVFLEFKDDYKAEIAEISKDNTIYVYIGENEFISGGLSAGAITEEGTIPLSSEEWTSDLQATTVANQIKTGMLALSLTQIACDEITPSYGIGASILLSIAIAVLVIAAFVFLIVKYKQMGWLTTFAMLFFIVISLFLLQSIPTIHMNLGGFIGFVVCLIVALDTLLAIIETAKKHYQEDAKLHVAFKMSLKENLTKTFINNVMLVVAGFVCMFIPSLAVKSFGWIAFVMPIVSIFTSMALMRLFIKMYLAINSEDGKKCNFHKGGKNA